MTGNGFPADFQQSHHDSYQQQQQQQQPYSSDRYSNSGMTSVSNTDLSKSQNNTTEDMLNGAVSLMTEMLQDNPSTAHIADFFTSAADAGGNGAGGNKGDTSGTPFLMAQNALDTMVNNIEVRLATGSFHANIKLRVVEFKLQT